VARGRRPLISCSTTWTLTVTAGIHDAGAFRRGWPSSVHAALPRRLVLGAGGRAGRGGQSREMERFLASACAARSSPQIKEMTRIEGKVCTGPTASSELYLAASPVTSSKRCVVAVHNTGHPCSSVVREKVSRSLPTPRRVMSKEKKPGDELRRGWPPQPRSSRPGCLLRATAKMAVTRVRCQAGSGSSRPIR